VVAEYQVEEQLRRVVSSYFGRDWSKMYHLAEAIDEDEDTGATLVVSGEAKYEVHADGSPHARGDGERA
jgi:hypothetical protein